MIQNVSVIGLGKLGGSMAAGMASRGLNVIGVDVNRHAVDAVNAGQAPVQETGLGEMIAANQTRIRATMSTEEAVLGSDLSFVIVPTPSDERGAFCVERQVSLGDIFATVYKAMGIQWDKEYMTPVGRPIKIANSIKDATGEPIKELVG